jgi:hypothetical protein
MPLSVEGLKALWQYLGRPSLETAPYEELLSHHRARPREVYNEFVRRLSELVFLAALNFCKRQGVAAVEEKAEALQTSAFQVFAPEMGSGEPKMVLRRFAATLRNVLDDEAFRTIERAYYRHLPLYHLRDNEQRRCLEAMLATALTATPQQIAKRFLLTAARVEELLKAGNRELERIVREDYEEDELRAMTEGRLP